MAADGPVRGSSSSTPRDKEQRLRPQTGYIAGSKALDSLDRLITSTESFFHPSNSGPWSATVNFPDVVLGLNLLIMASAVDDIFAKSGSKILPARHGGKSGSL